MRKYLLKVFIKQEEHIGVITLRPSFQNMREVGEKHDCGETDNNK